MFENDIMELYKEKKLYLKKSTVANYSSIINNLLLPYFKNIKTCEINNKILNNYVLTMLSNHSIKYIKDSVKVVEQLLNEKMENEEIPYFKINVKYPKNIEIIERNKKNYTKNEAKKIYDYCIENCINDNRFLGILLGLSLGLRIGEVCALKYKDINLKTKTIKINNTVQRVYDSFSKTTEIIESTPKTKNSRRELPLTDEILSLINKKQDNNFYLLNNKSTPIEPRTYRKFYCRIIKKLKLEYVNFHGLRHSFASLLITNGTDIKTVSELLGHANVSTTLSIYTHSNLDAKKKAIKKIGGLFNE